MGRLAGCSGCGRHIRTTEATCPFCGATATFETADAVQPTGRPLTRAAILFASATALAGCGKTTDHNMPAPAYGVPVPPDTVAVEAGPPPAVPDAGMMSAPAYGVPPSQLEKKPVPPGPPDSTKKK